MNTSLCSERNSHGTSGLGDSLNSPTAPSVLVVDDEPGIRAGLAANFSRRGWRVESAGGVREARQRLEQGSFDLVVSDIRMPDGDGMEVLRAVRRLAPEAAVILLTAFGNVPDAVAAMRSGASDYLSKPVAWEELEETAKRLLGRSHREHAQAASENGGIIGRAPRLLHAVSRARAAATTDADVLVEAESGTGKELLAKLIHESSDRAGKPFVAINCAAVPEHLLESELFGHARGAFTGATQAKMGKFELAGGGTLLLDEIGEMPLNLQPKLLRALQEREVERLGETRTIPVDIRVIATTNVSLADAVERGQFRSDLFYRLNVIPLSLPPLRERAGDIPLLAQYFAEQFAARARRPVPVLLPEFLRRLEEHTWPGNVRELGNFMQRVLSLHAGVAIDAVCFDLETQGAQRKAPAASGHATPITAGAPIRQLERLHLENTLAMTRGNRTHAAEMLGISLRTMRNRIREYGLPPRRYA